MVQREVTTDAAYVTRYDDVHEALDAAAREPRFTARASRTPAMGDDWSYGTWDDALRLARDGDPDLTRVLREKAGAFASIRYAQRPTSRWSPSGSLVDVGRFMAGEYDCMVETVRARRPAPVLKIAVERAVPWTRSTADMIAVGTSVLVAVEALRTAGVACEIWVTFTQMSSRQLSVQVRVQEPGRPVDVSRLAYWVVNPSAFRRLGFALDEQEDKDVQTAAGMLGGSYGYAVGRPIGSFDEVAPPHAAEVDAWLTTVLERRAGVRFAPNGRGL
jgi:hypothetical protein